MKILIIQTRPGIGDLCVFLPPIHCIAQNNAGATFDLITKERTHAKETLKYDTYINNIFYLENFNNSNLSLFNFIKKNSYDKAYIFHYGIRYPLICKIAGIKKIYSYGWLKKNENIVEKSKTACSNWLKVKNLDFSYQIFRPKKINSISENIIIGIGGSGPTKKWPTKNFIELIYKINKIKKYKFILAGGITEREISAQIIKAFPGESIYSLCNKNIEESLNSLENAKCYIGNDTGFMHICAGLGILSFGLFGDTPKNYSEYTTNIIAITPSNIQVVGHGSLAMNQITAEQVFAEVQRAI
jgi:heptosyltransferase-2